MSFLVGGFPSPAEMVILIFGFMLIMVGYTIMDHIGSRH